MLKRTKKSERGVRCELRENEDGTLDEAIVCVNGHCVFHLEQLNDSEWYMGLHHGKLKRMKAGHYNYEDTTMLTAWSRGKCKVTVNDIGRAKVRKP